MANGRIRVLRIIIIIFEQHSTFQCPCIKHFLILQRLKLIMIKEFDGFHKWIEWKSERCDSLYVWTNFKHYMGPFGSLELYRFIPFIVNHSHFTYWEFRHQFATFCCLLNRFPFAYQFKNMQSVKSVKHRPMAVFSVYTLKIEIDWF